MWYNCGYSSSSYHKSVDLWIHQMVLFTATYWREKKKKEQTSTVHNVRFVNLLNSRCREDMQLYSDVCECKCFRVYFGCPFSALFCLYFRVIFMITNARFLALAAFWFLNDVMAEIKTTRISWIVAWLIISGKQTVAHCVSI